MEVRLLIQTASANAQHQLDRLQRAAGNNDLQNLIETQGEVLHTLAVSRAPLVLMHALMQLPMSLCLMDVSNLQSWRSHGNMPVAHC